MAHGSLFSSGSSKRGVAVVGGCLLVSVFAVWVLVCSCLGGSMMGTLFAMLVAAQLIVGGVHSGILLLFEYNYKKV